MFEASAQQGYFAAFAPTAQMYVQGLGVPADPSKAYYWVQHRRRPIAPSSSSAPR